MRIRRELKFALSSSEQAAMRVDQRAIGAIRIRKPVAGHKVCIVACHCYILREMKLTEAMREGEGFFPVWSV